MLNNRGPKMEYWGTPKRIYFHELYAVFILVLGFLLDKSLCISLGADKLNP